MPRSHEALQRLVQNRIAVAQANAATRSSEAMLQQAETGEKAQKLSSLLAPIDTLSGVVNTTMGVIGGIDKLKTTKEQRLASEAARESIKQNIAKSKQEMAQDAEIHKRKMWKENVIGWLPFPTATREQVWATTMNELAVSGVFETDEQREKVTGLILGSSEFSGKLDVWLKNQGVAPVDLPAAREKRAVEFLRANIKDIIKQAREKAALDEDEGVTGVMSGEQLKEGGKNTIWGDRVEGWNALRDAGVDITQAVPDVYQNIFAEGASVTKKKKGNVSPASATHFRTVGDRGTTLGSQMKDYGPTGLRYANLRQGWEKAKSAETAAGGDGTNMARLGYDIAKPPPIAGFLTKYGGEVVNRTRAHESLKSGLRVDAPAAYQNLANLEKVPGRVMGETFPKDDPSVLRSVVDLTQIYAQAGALDGSPSNLNTLAGLLMGGKGKMTRDVAVGRLKAADRAITSFVLDHSGDAEDPSSEAFKYLERAGLSFGDLQYTQSILKELIHNTSMFDPHSTKGEYRNLGGRSAHQGVLGGSLMEAAKEDRLIDNIAASENIARNGDEWGTLRGSRSMGPEGAVASYPTNDGATLGQMYYMFANAELAKPEHHLNFGHKHMTGVPGSKPHHANQNISDWKNDFDPGVRVYEATDNAIKDTLVHKSSSNLSGWELRKDWQERLETWLKSNPRYLGMPMGGGSMHTTGKTGGEIGRPAYRQDTGGVPGRKKRGSVTGTFNDFIELEGRGYHFTKGEQPKTRRTGMRDRIVPDYFKLPVSAWKSVIFKKVHSSPK